MKRWACFVAVLFAMTSLAFADKVITKDGKTYSGKIIKQNKKVVLIANPPFEPDAILIQMEDVQTVIHDEYRLSDPGERRRGLALNLHAQGNAYSSDELSFKPSGGLSLEGGFRFHPLIELAGDLQWVPYMKTSGSGLNVSAGSASRSYQTFWMYTMGMTGKIYPFFNKKSWKTEPYLLGGYHFGKLIPKASGDSLKGDGWLAGCGAIHPLSRNVYLDGRFAYQSFSFDQIHFLGQSGDIAPAIQEDIFTFSVGISYRI